MATNKWKITAIIFICLFVLGIIVFIGLLSAGLGSIADENECSINICDGYDSYYFDEYDSICYCYTDHEITHQEYIR